MQGTGNDIRYVTRLPARGTLSRMQDATAQALGPAAGAGESRGRLISRIGLGIFALIIVQSYLAPLTKLVPAREISLNLLYLQTTISYTVIVLCVVVLGVERLPALGDHFSLWLVVAGCWIAAVRGDGSVILYRSLLGLLGLVLAGYIVANRQKLTYPGLRSLLTALLLAAGVTLLLSLLRNLVDPPQWSLPANIGQSAWNTFLYDLPFVGVTEEAYFRALLPGLLLLNGRSVDRALVVQGILFWGTHYMYIGAPVLFFVLIPVFTVCASLAVRRYNMLYMTIIMHTTYNVLGGILPVVLR